MILLVAVGAGWMAGAVRARVMKRRFQSVRIRSIWLVSVAFLMQLVVFFLPATRELVPDTWVAPALVISQGVLLIFAWQNRHVAGFGLLGLGLLTNFVVICLNGGMMPLTLQTAQQLLPPGGEAELQIGERVGYTKDILLEKEQTRLWILSDIFTLPAWMNYPVAFSIGDIFMSMGAFWLFWKLGGPQKTTQEVSP